MMSNFWHGHMSGRFDRSPESLGDAAEELIHCNLITGTEVSAERREQALRDFGEANGYGVVTGDKGGMDDSFIMHRESEFSRIAGGTRRLQSRVTYDEPGGGVTSAAWGVYVDEWHNRLLVLVAHQARSVEARGGLRGAAKYVRKWNADTRAMKALWNRLARQHRVDAVMVTCDWNINAKGRAVRALFKARFRGMKMAVRKPYPKRGTLGSRIIDFTIFRGSLKIRKFAVLPLDPASDHRMTEELVTLG